MAFMRFKRILSDSSWRQFSFSKGREYPIHDPHKVHVPIAFSEGGQLYAYDKGIKEHTFNLEMDRISQGDYDNFSDFFLNVVVGPKHIFLF